MSGLISRLTNQVSLSQLIKYGMVGLFSNAFGYAVYLLLTIMGCTPKLTMTALYCAGALIGFLGNSHLTFPYQGAVLGSVMRFLLVHLGGYAINYCLLAAFVDRLGYPHQWVQAIAIVLVSAYLFLTLKFFVFKARP